jgi:hypothetical protein
MAGDTRIGFEGAAVVTQPVARLGCLFRGLQQIKLEIAFFKQAMFGG